VIVPSSHNEFQRWPATALPACNMARNSVCLFTHRDTTIPPCVVCLQEVAGSWTWGDLTTIKQLQREASSSVRSCPREKARGHLTLRWPSMKVLLLRLLTTLFALTAPGVLAQLAGPADNPERMNAVSSVVGEYTEVSTKVELA
jgi:hypothetical protein